MALTKTPIELSSTPSIVDGGNATAITIDSSENVLVGKTASNATTPGHELKADGAAWHTADSTFPLFLNRETDDGELIRFRKDNSNVGHIGTIGGKLYIGSQDGSDAFLRFESNEISPCAHEGSFRDAVIDLGKSASRFKDLYLSGGAYLGGTAAANKLDDYETGTWTPTPSSGSFSTNIATYTKVGRLVTVRYFCLFNSAGSGSAAMTISGLPFNVINSNSGYAPGITMVDNLTTATNNMTIQATINSSTFILIGGNGSTSDHVGAAASLFSSGSSFRGTLVYETT